MVLRFDPKQINHQISHQWVEIVVALIHLFMFYLREVKLTTGNA
jgi:hypothetical protein